MNRNNAPPSLRTEFQGQTVPITNSLIVMVARGLLTTTDNITVDTLASVVNIDKMSENLTGIDDLLFNCGVFRRIDKHTYSMNHLSTLTSI